MNLVIDEISIDLECFVIRTPPSLSSSLVMINLLLNDLVNQTRNNISIPG